MLKKEQMNENELQFQILNKYFPGGILGVYLDDSFSCYFINERLLEFLAYDTEEEFLLSTNNNMLNCVYNKDQEMLVDTIKRSMDENQKEFSFTFRFIRKNGTFSWVICKGKVSNLENNKKVVMGVCIDLSEQMQLREQLELYRKASRGGAFEILLDDKLTLLYANDIFYDVHEYTQENYASSLNNQCIYTIHEEDRGRIIQFLQKSIVEHKVIIEWEMRILTGKNNVRWLSIKGNIQYSKDKNIMTGFVVDITEAKTLELEVKKNALRQRIALQNANITLWELDIIENKLIRYDDLDRFTLLPKVLYNVPQALIESNIIAKESHDAILSVFKKVRLGEPKVEADIKNNASNGKPAWWEHLVITTIFDEDGNPISAIAIGEDITKQKEMELYYENEMNFKDYLSARFISRTKSNISKNKIETIEIYTNTLDNNLSKDRTYDVVLEAKSKSITNEDDRKRFLDLFSRTSLLESFANGKNLIHLDFRRKEEDGKIRWVNKSVRLFKEGNQEDIFSYSVMRDINDSKTMELGLQQRAEVDSITHSYNKETALELIKEGIISAQKEGIGYGLLLFNIDFFSQLVHQVGYKITDAILQRLNELIIEHLDDAKVVGRMYSDEMIVWFNGDIQRNNIIKCADSIRRSIQESMAKTVQDIPITVSIGISISDSEEFSLHQLLERAELSINKCKERGGNQCVIFNEDKLDANTYSKSYLQTEDQYKELRSAMAKYNDLFASKIPFSRNVKKILKQVGLYYNASAIHVIQMEEDFLKIRRYYEWTDENNPMDIEIKTGSTYEQWKSNVVSSSSYKILEVNEGTELDADTIYDFNVLVFPCERNGVIYGYIVFSNIRKNKENIIFIEPLRYYVTNILLQRTLQRMFDKQEFYDSLSGLMNRTSYTNFVSHFVADIYISIGIVSIDINRLKLINHQFGDAYGDELIQFIAKTMMNTFSEAHNFRLAGDEFLAICPNHTFDSFVKQVNQFKEEVLKEYPNAISIGKAWTDQAIEIEHLIFHAEEQMLLSKQVHYKQSTVITRRHDPRIEDELIKEIQDGRYVMYLQPKSCIKKNIISGAEALVRYRHADGTIVFPDQFIPRLEQEGNIHHIDLFIFEEVCKLLSKWKEEGLPLIPISLNFSRITLLSGHLTKKIEEIFNRYHIDKEFLEIEITENMGSVERDTIIRIGTDIVNHNYRLALDDFGAKYSNLSILSSLKLHVVKLDRSIVNDLFSNQNTRVVVKSFLQACKELDIRSVAEGVETIEQLNILSELGCDYAQGYYLNKPIPISEFEKLYIKASRTI